MFVQDGPPGAYKETKVRDVPEQNALCNISQTRVRLIATLLWVSNTWLLYLNPRVYYKQNENNKQPSSSDKSVFFFLFHLKTQIIKKAEWFSNRKHCSASLLEYLRVLLNTTMNSGKSLDWHQDYVAQLENLKWFIVCPISPPNIACTLVPNAFFFFGLFSYSVWNILHSQFPYHSTHKFNEHSWPDARCNSEWNNVI